MRRLVLGAAVLLAIGLAATSIGQAAGESVAAFARDAAKLGGYSPSKSSKKNTVVVRGSDGKIDPASLPLGAPRFTNSTIDRGGGFTENSSTTIGEDGLGLIVYGGLPGEVLKVAHCLNVRCSAATKATLARSARAGEVAIGADGLGLITYRDVFPAFAVGVAHCENVACSATRRAKVETIWPRGVVSQSSITIGADGRGLIAYAWDNSPNTQGEVKVAHCENVRCSSATLTRIDFLGGGVSITTGADGLGLVSYIRWPDRRLVVAHCENVVCSSATTSTVDLDAAGGSATSIRVGADGLGLIAYLGGTLDNPQLRVAHCQNASCSQSTHATIDASSSIDTYGPSLAVGSDLLGVIAYEAAGLLKVAHCRGVSCSAASIATIANTGARSGSGNSIAVGLDGMGLISYYDSAKGQIRAVHCSNTFCVPYARR